MRLFNRLAIDKNRRDINSASVAVRSLIRFLTGVLIYLFIILLYKNGLLETIELYAYDKLIQQFSITSHSSPVTVINIDEADINQMDSYPVSDGVLAEVLSKIATYEASVIGFDIFRNIPVPPGQKKLETFLSEYPNVIAPMKYGNSKSTEILPPAILRGVGRFGFTDGLVDRDNILRRALLTLHKDQQTPYYSFALHITLLYLQEKNITFQSDENKHLQLGTTSIVPLKPNDGGYVNEDTKGYQFLFDFCKPPESIRRYTLAQFKSGQIKREDFKDKIVLVGMDAESVKDHFYMPCSAQETGHEKLISGVMIHAGIIDQLVRIAKEGHAPIKTAEDWQEMLWILIWTIIGGLVSWRQYSLRRLIVIWLVGFFVLIGLTAFLFAQGVWLIVATPALALLLSGILSIAHRAAKEQQQRTQLMNLFSKHVSPEIAEELWQKQEMFFKEGRALPQQTIATVLFTDLKNATSLAEELKPAAFFDWLNEYLNEMTPLVAKHKGVVIRFIGDAIFAGFGIPVPRQSEAENRQDAINAVSCALEMNEKLIQLNKQWQQQDIPVVAMRIGLYTGTLAIGSIGTQERMEFAIQGDAVNIAARLETFDKHKFTPDYFRQPCRILIGGKTVEYLAGQFLLEAMGKVELKGKKEKVDVYRVVGKVN